MELAFQIGGTASTVVAASIILLKLCRNPASQIPVLATCFQLAASTNWALFAASERLWMLLACSCMNVVLYVISTSILMHNTRRTAAPACAT